MKIKLRCLGCGHVMELDEAYEDYEGEVRCWGCTALLDVKLQESKLKTMSFVRFTRPSAEEALERSLG